jgi:hypothetical protein
MRCLCRTCRKAAAAGGSLAAAEDVCLLLVLVLAGAVHTAFCLTWQGRYVLTSLLYISCRLAFVFPTRSCKAKQVWDNVVRRHTPAEQRHALPARWRNNRTFGPAVTATYYLPAARSLGNSRTGHEGGPQAHQQTTAALAAVDVQLQTAWLIMRASSPAWSP